MACLTEDACWNSRKSAEGEGMVAEIKEKYGKGCRGEIIGVLSEKMKSISWKGISVVCFLKRNNVCVKKHFNQILQSLESRVSPDGYRGEVASHFQRRCSCDTLKMMKLLKGMFLYLQANAK